MKTEKQETVISLRSGTRPGKPICFKKGIGKTQGGFGKKNWILGRRKGKNGRDGREEVAQKRAILHKPVWLFAQQAVGGQPGRKKTTDTKLHRQKKKGGV